MVKGKRLCLLLSGALIATGTLWGCGGGGGGGGGAVAKGPSGRLTQGPVLNATIFADNIGKGTRFSRDSDEVWTTTDPVTGDFTLPTTPNYNYVLVSQGGTDKLTGQNAMQMVAPAGSANVTPLTTLVALDTTGTVKAKLEALMPPGAKFDADISVVSSPAALLVAKSVEATVATLTNAITSAAGAGVISPAQISAIQAQTMQSITQEFAEPTTTAATLSVPNNLTTSLESAAVAMVASVNSTGNITVPADTASTAAASAVGSSATLLALPSNESASAAAVTGGEAAAMSTRVDQFNADVGTATTTAALTTDAAVTPVSYVPPPIQVVTTITVPPPANGQTIGAISFSPAVLNIGGHSTVSAMATSGLGVTFSSATPAVCSVSATTVTANIDGMCVVTANQAGNSTYSAATMVQSYVTVRANQSIGAITAEPATVLVGDTATLTAAATSGLAVTFNSATPTVCTVADGMVTGVAAGACIVSADQIGDGNYVAATQVSKNLTVVKKPQAITITTMPATGKSVGQSFTVAANAPGGTVVYSSSTPNICSNVSDGPTFTLLSTASDCVVNYDQPGSNVYSAAPQLSNSTSATPQAQTISYGAYNPTTADMGDIYAIDASTSSGLGLTFTTTTPGVCTFAQNVLSPVTPGSCQFSISQPGDTRYSAALSLSESITVAKKAQLITVTQPAPATALVGEQFSVSAMAPGGGVTYTSNTPGVCTLFGSNSIFKMNTSGTCEILFNQAGDTNYAAAPQVSNTTISTKLSQTIGVIGYTAVSNNASTLSAAATSQLSVTFASATTAVCTVSGTTATIVASGTCTVSASQGGDASYSAAPTRFVSFAVTYVPPANTGGTGGTGNGI